jgi:chemosensory pili system protein ChpA (sensor histidine kinase/response regulator)
MPNPDSTLLSWITAEVNQALMVVREQIAKFSAEPENGALLQPCPGHLHQVSGALRMVGLSGATRFAEAIEAGFGGLNGARPDHPTLEVLDRAVLALKDFMEGLERGQPNLPLRLYPVYRELTALHGKPEGSEKDLFFPDLSLSAPAHPDPKALPKENLAPCLLARRGRFQRGLLAWLRNLPAGLEDMTQAVQTLHQLAPDLPEPRALWWAALGLLEILKESTDAAWIGGAKLLCNKLDFHMRDLAAGAGGGNEGLLREMLYAIGRSKASTPLAKEIRGFYQLDSLFPAPPSQDAAPSLELNSEWLEAALYDLHSRLEALKSAWVHYISGEHKSAARFRELVASFKAKAGELGNQHLIKLLDAIVVVTKHLPDPYPRHNQYMVIEMASAFLLIESVIDRFGSPPADLEQQIVILGGWVLDAAKGKSNGEPPAGLRGDLLQKVGGLQLRTQVAKEISANLQHIEQVLDSFARDPSKRESLEGLGPYLRQVHGALKVLEFHRAAEATAICENMIAACALAELEQANEEMDWIAEGLSSVGLYLGPCLQGREPNDQALDLFFQRFGGRVERLDAQGRAGITHKLDATQPKTQKLPPERQNVDAELVGIFLDEAGEVLQRIETTLAAAREQPDELDSLTIIRRGFHTLKGSGRMVGLMDLGEVAWEIEQLMTLWLEQKRPATAALLDLLGAARKAFSSWVAKLREGSLEREVDAEPLVQAAHALRSAPLPVPAQPAPPAPPTEPEDITIGNTTLTRAFFEIYIKEATEHVATLEAQFAAWRAAPGTDASQSFTRAAHTLASSSGTAGFAELASLAGAIEQWIPFAPQTRDAHDAQVLQDAIARLRAMTDAMARREEPGDAAEEAARLKALTARLESPATPQILAPPPAAPAKDAGRPKRVLYDDIDEQLLPVFLEEAHERVPAIGADLRDWKANPNDENVSQSLRRGLHTLKGSARMAGAIRLGELTHLMESAIEAAIEANAYPPELFADLEDKMDRLSADVERMGVAPAPPEFTDKAGEAPLPQSAAMLRVNADTLDHLINEAGEVSIARSRVEAELRLIRQSLNDLSESISRLRGQLREVEIQADSQMQSRLSVLEERKGDYDPLEFDRYTRLQELTRLMAESLNDVVSIQQALGKNLAETDAALLAQTRTNREVQQELMRMRAVPFSNLNERLYRVVRQTARELDKKAELEVEGAEVELDRSVLERIAAPLEHMLRNALAHGVESPAARAAAGKAETGRIGVTLRQEANEILLILSDDGAGIDLERLYQKAIDKGIVASDQALSEAERVQLVFASGLSTADALTELAGRGVGMDVVRNEIAAIGGRIDIATTRGQGTTFTIYLPLTLAVTQAVLVRVGGSLFALSTGMVEQVLRLKSDAMAELYANKRVEFQDRSYPLHSLQHMLGGLVATELQNYNSVLLLRSGIHRIALHVDELMGNQEIVVKSLGPQLARMAWISGATVLADGSIVTLINPVVLARRTHSGLPDLEHTTLVPQLPGRGKVNANAPVIMVVDDSLTVRKITSRLLEREGYQVLTAKDGLDALQQLRETLPAVMLVDIEMPRMDGFDLTRNVRGDARTRHIPIIVISSRTADKHRSQAAALGVNAFLGKPYQEAELLERIGAFLGAPVQ